MLWKPHRLAVACAPHAPTRRIPIGALAIEDHSRERGWALIPGTRGKPDHLIPPMLPRSVLRNLSKINGMSERLMPSTYLWVAPHGSNEDNKLG